jgi:uncharacterized damage-inducible protein DinB
LIAFNARRASHLKPRGVCFMTVEDFRTLYNYNSWANDRTLDACALLTPEKFTRDLGSSFGSVRDTLVHLCGAEWIWMERWLGRSPSSFPQATEFTDFGLVRTRLSEIDRDLLAFVAALTADEVQRVVQFKTMAGAQNALPLRHCLQHLANHGTYHRGQITTLLRQLGAKAVGTDLIMFYREKSSQTGG